MSEHYSTHRPSRNRSDAVRLFCVECMGASVEPGFERRPHREVRECPDAHTCSLWPYRLVPIPAAGNIDGDKAPRTRSNDRRGETGHTAQGVQV